MAHQVVKREALKDAVNAQLENLAPNGELIIVGLRIVANGKMELEYAQARLLRSTQASMLTMNNRYTEGNFGMNTKQIHRVWQIADVQSMKENIGYDLTEAFEMAQKIAADERVTVMLPVDKFTNVLDGRVGRPIIKVYETTNINSLSKSRRESVENQDEYASNIELQAPNSTTKKMEPVVDESGNQVYRWRELEVVYGNESIDDVLVPNKNILSQLLEKINNNKTGVATKNLLEGLKPVEQAPLDLNIG